MSDPKNYLEALGLEPLKLKKTIPIVADTVKNQDDASTAFLNWDEVKDRVDHCVLCRLCETRTHAVFGAGNAQADLLVVGEGPGANEDLQGEPFVGRAGQLLNSILKAIHLDRQDIFITNVVKCRPPNNRDPLPDEVSTCTPYLLRQIELLKPKLIVALGRVAGQFLLDTKTPLSQLRQTVHNYQGTPLVLTYHPAYLLRSPGEKARAWQDWSFIQAQLNQLQSR